MVGKEEVLTNCHVVRRSQRITVMKGALRYPVDSQKVDIFKDLCLLKAPDLSCLPLNYEILLSYGSVIMPIFMAIQEAQMHFLPKAELVVFTLRR